MQQNVLSASVIDQEIVVVDGGDDGNPTICPPEGVNWRVLSVRNAIHLHVQDEHDPLPFAVLMGCYRLLDCLVANPWIL